MTVGRPCVEGEEGSKHAEANEDEGEKCLLDGYGNKMRRGSYLVDVHGERTAILTVEVVDAEDTEDEQCRTAHEHEGQLHGCILLLARTPDANEQVHGDKSNFVEHKHGEHVGADKEAEDTR